MLRLVQGPKFISNSFNFVAALIQIDSYVDKCLGLIDIIANVGFTRHTNYNW